MEKWKVFSAHENLVLGRDLALADARMIARNWAENAGRCHSGYVPGWIIDANGSLITVIYREKGAAVCKADGSRFHMQLPCMCKAGVIGLYDSIQPL